MLKHHKTRGFKQRQRIRWCIIEYSLAKVLPWARDIVVVRSRGWHSQVTKLLLLRLLVHWVWIWILRKDRLHQEKISKQVESEPTTIPMEFVIDHNPMHGINNHHQQKCRKSLPEQRCELRCWGRRILGGHKTPHHSLLTACRTCFITQSIWHKTPPFHGIPWNFEVERVLSWRIVCKLALHDTQELLSCYIWTLGLIHHSSWLGCDFVFFLGAAGLHAWWDCGFGWLFKSIKLSLWSWKLIMLECCKLSSEFQHNEIRKEQRKGLIERGGRTPHISTPHISPNNSITTLMTVLMLTQLNQHCYDIRPVPEIMIKFARFETYITFRPPIIRYSLVHDEHSRSPQPSSLCW